MNGVQIIACHMQLQVCIFLNDWTPHAKHQNLQTFQVVKLSTRLDTDDKSSICILAFQLFFFFFGKTCTVGPMQEEKSVFFCFSSNSRVLFIGPTSTLLKKKKNFVTRSHSTIHIFKNYFATIFLVFSKINSIQIHPQHRLLFY